jgi:transcriptional regulator with XRE-family HTH domain
MKDDKNIIGINIKKLREALGMTQKTLSRLTDIYIPQISKYEHGVKTPSTASLVKISRALHCSYNKLIDADN